MSRTGMLYYFSYMFILTALPLQGHDQVDFADGDQIQFAVDIHETLTTKVDYSEKLSRLQKCKLYAFGLCGYLPAKIMKKCGLLNMPENDSIEGILHAMPWFFKLVGTDVAQHVGDIQHEIQPEMKTFLQSLAQRYDIKVLSNIGLANWAKMKGRYADVFNEHVVRDGIIIDYAAGQKTKPQDEPFDRFERECWQVNPRTEQKKLIIFLDDKQVNIDAANRRPGWIGVRFTSLHQLKTDLTQLGVVFDDAVTEDVQVSA